MREIVSPLDGFASPFGPQRGFNPLRIFANDEPGAWFEANDSTTLFTDVAGTTPVTAPGDAVALQLDKSQGLTLGPELVDADLNTLFADRAEITATATEILFDTTVGDQISSALGGSIASGSTYEVSFEVFDVVSGGVVLRLGNPALSDTPSLTAGSYSFKLNADGTQIAFRTGQPDTELKLRNISVRELPGNHRTQATTAARPLYALHPVGGVRNLLEYTEDYSEWFSNAAGGEEFDAIAPDGTATALKVTFGTSPPEVFIPPDTSITGQTVLGFFAKADSARPLRISARAGGVITGGYFGSANLTSDWQFFEFPKDSGADEITQIRFQNGGTTEERTVPVYVWHPQFEQSSTATNYQRVGSFLDVSEEGKARRGRLWYNGTSHFMETGTITPGTDKVQVFAGVRKLSAAAAVVAEASANVNLNNGALALFVGDSAGRLYSSIHKGTTISAIGLYIAAPHTGVFTSLNDIVGDLNKIRVNATEAQSTADQGTGNYLAYPIYFGARAGTTAFFNGYEDTSIIRFGPNLDDTTISKVESYVASKTPEETI